MQRLLSVPGIGLLTATALVAFVGDVQRFSSGRRFASYLGLTPREHSSGSRRRLGRISKRGDVYLRMLLVHGSRAALNAATRHKNPDRLRAWAEGCESSPVGYLEGWYVAEHARLHGIGGRLVAAAEDWARSRGCIEMASDTELANRVSEAAHLRLGYQVAARVTAFRKRLT